MFVIGLIGFITRRNLIVIFLCTELMFQGVAINLIAFSRYTGNLAGQAFVIFCWSSPPPRRRWRWVWSFCCSGRKTLSMPTRGAI